MNKRMKLIGGIFLLFLLCGCQKAPVKEVVTSKNGGVFQDKIKETNPNADHMNIDPKKIVWDEDFQSTDGSVSFHVDIDSEVSPNVYQVVEVEPHMLTEEDIHRVATALLGNADYYERRSSSHPAYSKQQYQEMIARLAPYATKENLVDLMGSSRAEIYLEYVKLFIDGWTEDCETAPEEDPRTPCDWKLKKERMYNDSEIDIGPRSLDEDMDVLYANAQKNGVEYTYYVMTHTGGTYKLNSIVLQLTDGIGLFDVDMAIYRSMLCRTEEPTSEQIAAVVLQAQTMLEQMELGDWEIVSTEVEVSNVGAEPEYMINLQAQPIINGVSSILGQPEKASEDTYAPTYQMTSAHFTFSGHGDIVYFDLASPVDVLDVPNENVSTLSVDELAEKCMQQLSLSDRGSYGLPDYFIDETEDYTGERLLCQVNIMEAEYGLGRVRVPNVDDNYYYIPVMAFRGSVVYSLEDSGAVYYDNTPSNSEEPYPILLCINAVDGTIISD